MLMLDTTYQIIAGIVLLAVITVAYGGTFVLRVMRGQVPANDLQKSFFRAGHAHAAVLIILGLVILILVQNNDVGQPFTSLSTGVLWAAILMPAGFFLSVIGRDPKQPNRLIILLWLGAAVLTVGLLSAGIGLLVAA
jgi:hypothetical protein